VSIPRDSPTGRSGDWLHDLAGAWIFYSVLPPWPWPRPRFQRIARFAPLVGLVIGAVQAGLWWMLAGGWPLAARVLLVVALGLGLSGGIHADGLMDTADGLAAPDESRLQAMDDSRVGAAAVIAILQALMLRSAALLALDQSAPAALVAAAVWGRWSPMVAMDRFRYIKVDGTAAFHTTHWRGLAQESVPMLGLVVVAGMGCLGWGWPWWMALGVIPSLAVPIVLGHRLRGHSGDSYGACVVWSESLTLLVMGLVVIGL